MTELDPIVQAVAEALHALNADGWMVVPHPNTGEPMQERLPVSYLAEAALAAARPLIEREALEQVRKVVDMTDARDLNPEDLYDRGYLNAMRTVRQALEQEDQ